MSDLAISVRGLGKSYVIAHQEKPTLASEALLAKLRNPFGRVSQETFWALKDVSFDVQKGDVVGIIGRNGAGKSTLLKVLSRITTPTTGEVRIYGRVGSLLEVGTGFHPELTGRENIFLNGSILGMRRSEIQKQFDEIVDFAEVEKFLDTPVKRYSSGMYVRLAFAVAAHLNPEILIVDEVLAVGDAQFQKKCLGKMQDVSRREGRTVLFVSHNMAAVSRLCRSGLLLREGCLTFVGSSAQTVKEYLSTSVHGERTTKCEVEGVSINLIEWRDTDGNPASCLLANARAELVIHIENRSSLRHRIATSVTIRDQSGNLVTSVCMPEEGLGWVSIRRSLALHFTTDALRLLPGTYTLAIDLYGLGRTLSEPEALVFDVVPAAHHPTAISYTHEHGVMRLIDRASMEVDSGIMLSLNAGERP